MTEALYSVRKKGKRLEEGADMRSEGDALGSYTGVPRDGGLPRQDADDL